MPGGEVRIQSLAKGKKPVSDVRLLGSDEKLSWKQEADALVIQRPSAWPCKHAVAFRIAE